MFYFCSVFNRKLMITLYLVRHGETEENIAHILQGHLPGTLSARGIEQLRALHDQLADVNFDSVVCSDLRRCVDSACILTEDRHLPIVYLDLLRERDWGSFTGKCIDDVQHTAFPPDVESIEHLLARADQFLQYIKEHYEGQTVLAVSHGLFGRAIRSVATRVPMKDINRMENATFRVLTL